MIIELHLLQSFPVSNLNRDDVGQPKSVQFGGYNRARVSSQSWKRAARGLFTQHGLEPEETGKRTKRLGEAAAEVLCKKDSRRGGEMAQDIALAGLATMGFGIDKRGLSEYLLFVGSPAIAALAEYCDKDWDLLAKAVKAKQAKAEKAKKDGKDEPATDKKKQKQEATAKLTKAGEDARTKIMDASSIADIALFGRMIADNKGFEVTGACQVAHAISTHAVASEFDYFTAVDDLKADSESGADMIGTVDFNAACYYRYANVDLSQLAKNLPKNPELVRRAANAWLRAFIEAVPGGKQSTMAARTVPDTLLGVVRRNGAWSLANAFLNPVAGEGDYMAESARRLTGEFEKIRKFYGDDQLQRVSYASLTAGPTVLADVDNAESVDAFVAGLLAGAEI